MIVVISAINLFTGGPLTIAQDFLCELQRARRVMPEDLKVIVFCHSAKLYERCRLANVHFIEKPHSRKNWLVRLFYEYVWFWFWSRNKDIDFWISLHDITPNVKAKHRYVYCHNPAPFYSGEAAWKYEPTFELFRMFYGYLYRANIRKNDGVIVQQQWIRKAFVRKFRLSPDKVIVALPERGFDGIKADSGPVPNSVVKTIIYPAIPRPFKNFEVLLRAMAILERVPLKLVLTIDGQENRYARDIRARFQHLKHVEFAGYLSRDEMCRLYRAADAMVFPSKLETWGLPISEFKDLQKPIIAVDLPYAHETVGNYAKVAFFDKDNHVELAAHLRKLAEGDFKRTDVRTLTSYEPPFAQNWFELFRVLGIVQK